MNLWNKVKVFGRSVKNRLQNFVGEVKTVTRVAVAAIGFGVAGASAQAAPILPFATIDLSDVTDNITALGTAVVAAAAAVILAALSVGAVFYGGKALWRFFKSLAK